MLSFSAPKISLSAAKKSKMIHFRQNMVAEATFAWNLIFFSKNEKNNKFPVFSFYFEVAVCTQGAWPSSNIPKCPTPIDLEHAVTCFVRFYEDKHVIFYFFISSLGFFFCTLKIGGKFHLKN
jgi:hypothetical protein